MIPLSFEFIKEEIEKEGYQLLSKEYNNRNEKLQMICSHGHYYCASFASFKSGKRCAKCSGNKKKDFSEVKNIIEKENYNIISKQYENAHKKLLICCDQNHIYEASLHSFINGRRCPVCSKKKKHSYSFVKNYVEEQGYTLLSKEYKNNHEKIRLKCNVGHEYETRFRDFQRGHRCFFCFGPMKHSFDVVRSKIKEFNYELISTSYENAKKYLLIKCEKGHEYRATYDAFHNGNRCPICARHESKGEKEIVDFLNSLSIETIIRDRNIIKPYELDIVIPSKKIGIEYCGLYWHCDLYKDRNYHLNKLIECNEKKYRLITIFEDEWNNKKDIVKKRLKYLVGLETEKINGRECIVKEIDKNDAKFFFDKYHIQAYKPSTIYLGCFYKDSIVSAMSFLKRKENVYEMTRFCSSKNVVGAASKILKYFIRNYNWSMIITFADRRWSEGNLYKKLKFSIDTFIRPDYSYFKNGNLKRFHKFGFRRSKILKKNGQCEENLSESVLMKLNGWFRIFDCGKIKFIKKNQ